MWTYILHHPHRDGIRREGKIIPRADEIMAGRNAGDRSDRGKIKLIDEQGR